jgi:ABC-type transport system substrate-binding protein
VGGVNDFSLSQLSFNPIRRTQPQGGVLRIALQDGPSSLDPNLAPAIQDAIVHGALYDSLVGNDVALQPQPALATAWAVAEYQTICLLDCYYHHTSCVPSFIQSPLLANCYR